MEAPSSTGRWRRSARRTLMAVAGAVGILVAGTAAPVQADPGDVARVAKLNRQIAKLDKQYGGDLAKLQDAQYGIKKALKKSRSLKSDLDASRDLVAQLAATQYMTSGADPTVAIIASDDPSRTLNSASLFSHVAQNKAAHVSQINKLLAEQDKARKEYEGKVKELEKDIAELNRERGRIRVLVKKYKPESPSAGLAGMTPRMSAAKKEIDTEFGPFPLIGCVRYSGDPQDHATGQACDFMESTGGAMPTPERQRNGDAVSAYAIKHASRLGIKYVIWRQRIYDMRNPGWRSMENRGGLTANHYDHVHISVF